MRRLTCVSIAFAPVVAPSAQTPRVLDRSQIELAEPFTNVGSVRELSDGRVIVVDNGDRAVYVVDFTAGTSTQIGRPGGGPSEYRNPGILLPLPGDTTLLADAGNRRLLVIGPSATPIATLTDMWPMTDGAPGTRLPRGIDGRGRGYFLASAATVGANGAIVPADSAQLVRAPRGSKVDEALGYVRLAPRRISTTTKDGAIASVNIVIPPFPAQDAWQPFPDGAVALVRVHDYRVDWMLPDGRRVTGRPIPFTPVKVTQQDKNKRAGGASATRGTAPAGKAAGAPPAIDWPELKPPFAWTGVLAGSDGRVWVQRYGPATDSRARYDVIDRRGVVVAKVDVPNDGRIVGFGAKSIYVVRKDEDDLQYLQRFALQ